MNCGTNFMRNLLIKIVVKILNNYFTTKLDKKNTKLNSYLLINSY